MSAAGSPLSPEVARPLRFAALLGLWIAASPWLLAGASAGARWNDVIAGLLIPVLCLPRGPVRERYGRWDRFIR